MKKIILDTNFLLIPAQFKVDIFRELDRICDFEYKVFIVDRTLFELTNIIETQKGKDKAAANLAIQIIEKNSINILKSTEKTETLKNVDEIIERTANRKEYIVATQDKALKTKLKEKRIPLIVLRQKKYLKLERG